MRSVGTAAAEVLRAHCAGLGKPYVVTPPQWGVLSALAAKGEQPISTLSQHLAVETPAVTALVTRLEQSGLVERVHDRDDRRVVRVSLTSEGRAIVRALNPVMAEFNERLTSPGQVPDFIQRLQELIVCASAQAPARGGRANALHAAPNCQTQEEL